MRGFVTWAKRRLYFGDLWAQQWDHGTPPAPPSNDALLLEDGDFLLLENGDKILLG